MKDLTPVLFELNGHTVKGFKEGNRYWVKWLSILGVFGFVFSRRPIYVFREFGLGFSAFSDQMDLDLPTAIYGGASYEIYISSVKLAEFTRAMVQTNAVGRVNTAKAIITRANGKLSNLLTSTGKDGFYYDGKTMTIKERGELWNPYKVTLPNVVFMADGHKYTAVQYMDTIWFKWASIQPLLGAMVSKSANKVNELLQLELDSDMRRFHSSSKSPVYVSKLFVVKVLTHVSNKARKQSVKDLAINMLKSLNQCATS